METGHPSTRVVETGLKSDFHLLLVIGWIHACADVHTFVIALLLCRCCAPHLTTFYSRPSSWSVSEEGLCLQPVCWSAYQHIVYQHQSFCTQNWCSRQAKQPSSSFVRNFMLFVNLTCDYLCCCASLDHPRLLPFKKSQFVYFNMHHLLFGTNFLFHFVNLVLIILLLIVLIPII